MSKNFLSGKLSWRDFEILACICTLIINIACLVLIYLYVSQRCAEIFLSGDDCGVGIGWYCLAAGLVGTGAYSGWMLYLLEKERAGLTGEQVPEH